MSQRNLILAILGTSLGAALLFTSCLFTDESTRLACNASTQAETIRAAELAGRPADANRHLQITDFRFGHDYIYTGKADAWDKVWIVLVDPASPAEKPIVLGVMTTRRVKNRTDYAVLRADSSFTGMNVTGVNAMPTETQNQFAGYYPGVEFAQIPVFEEGATPPSAEWMLGWQITLLASLAITLLSIVLWVVTAKWQMQGARAA